MMPFSSLRPIRPRAGASRSPVCTTAWFVLLLCGSPLALWAAGDGQYYELKDGRSFYVVELEEPPVMRYQGGLSGLAATAPDVSAGANKSAFRVDSSAVRQYRQFLKGRQNQVLTRMKAQVAGDLEPHFRYRVVRNGFAMALTPQQAAQVSQVPGVVRVRRDRLSTLNTLESTEGIGATGVWDGSGVGGAGSRGEGVVIGVIDTGIRFDHPAFSDAPEDGYVYSNPFGDGTYLGWCDPSHPQYDPAYACNNKVIGAWDFADGIEINFVLDGVQVVGLEADGPQDDNGHGSGTAGVAAANFVEDMNLIGTAPRAQIVAYDACITLFRVAPPLGNVRFGGAGLCPNVSTLASIEQAILDGVDVINYSISGGTAPWDESNQERLFLDAVAAGIFVASASGNAGNVESSVSHLGPWVATTAATVKIQEQVQFSTVGEMSGGSTPPPAPFDGSGFDPEDNYPNGTPIGELIYGGDLDCVGFSCENPSLEPRHCAVGYEPGILAGKILICDERPNTPSFAALSLLNAFNDVMPLGVVVVQNAPDKPLPLIDVDGLSTPPDAPLFVLVPQAEGEALKAWARDGGPPHFGSLGSLTPPSPPRETFEDFTSRGPNPAFNVMKPDFGAPGRNIVAPNRAQQVDDEEAPEPAVPWSGTSFAGPHVAGAAALIKSLHPEWTSPQILSALLTTTQPDIEEEGTFVPATPHDVGAGRVDVALAAKAGLVLDTTIEEFLGANPAVGGTPEDLNLASMMSAVCATTCSWTRTVKNVSGGAGTWTAGVDAPSGLGVTVTPDTLNLAEGAFGTFEVRVDITPEVATAPWEFAAVTWTPSGGEGGVPATRLPVVVGGANGRVLDSVQILTREAVGSQVVSGFGFGEGAAPALTLSVSGAAGLDVALPDVPEDPTSGEPYNDLTEVHYVTFDVTADSRLLWVEIGETTSPDVDLYVGFDANGNGLPSENEVRCQSTRFDSLESCLVRELEVGTWWAVVQNFQASAPGGSDLIEVKQTLLQTLDLGNLTAAAPSSVGPFTPFDVTFAWALPSLEPGLPYLALVDFGSTADMAGDLGSTLVEIRYDGNAPTSRLFSDGFESGNTSAWSSSIP